MSTRAPKLAVHSLEQDRLLKAARTAALAAKAETALEEARAENEKLRNERLLRAATEYTQREARKGG